MISDLNFHLTIRTILQGENFLFSKENEDTYNPTTNGDSFVFFFIFCALAALPTTPVDFFDNSSCLLYTSPSILPDMTHEEALESTEIWSVAGLTDSKHPMLTQRPFRSPHHTLSAARCV